MAKPDRYWLERLKKDRALAERAAHEVEEEVRRAYRSQYLQVARKLDLLYAEANRTGTLSRTKLWNYKRWRELEADLVKYCEAGHVIQRDAITKALDSVFEDVIGTGVEVFQREKYILPYTPRAVIDTSWSGEHYSERIWKNQQALAARLREDAQQILMGDKSPAEVKRMLQKDYDVSWGNASRLVDTELSYVVNRANAENYRRMGVTKVTIVNLDVNTCEKCKALEGEVFALEDAPVLPIHPRCHCSYCAPRDGDAAEITASGNDLEEVYQRKGVKGYGETPKQYAPKGTSPSRLQAKVDEAAKAFRKPEVEPEKANAQAIAGNPENADSVGDLVLSTSSESAIIKVEEIRRPLNNDKAIPGAVEAVIAQRKLAGYLLDMGHKQGGPKAKLIRDVSGYTADDWQLLGEEIQKGLETAESTIATETKYGRRYEVPIRVKGKKNRSMIYYTVWQIDKGTKVARFITSKFNVKTIREVEK